MNGDGENGNNSDELMTLESAARNERDWWSHLSVGKDLNGLHHSSKYFDMSFIYAATVFPRYLIFLNQFHWNI